ncbi:MAG TPA: HNH endonuclease signature motif containing protein [Gemmatimonadales bacterium]|nr:HNH endonuclease signature motif containing protein [Gemmatimonadales bacterium]
MKRTPLVRRTPLARESSSARRLRRIWNLRRKGEDRCRVCGRRADALHHAVPRSLAPAGREDLRNGLPLCRDHHDGWHGGTPIPRVVFKPEEWAFIEQIAPGIGWLGRRYPR